MIFLSLLRDEVRSRPLPAHHSTAPTPSTTHPCTRLLTYSHTVCQHRSIITPLMHTRMHTHTHSSHLHLFPHSCLHIHSHLPAGPHPHSYSLMHTQRLTHNPRTCTCTFTSLHAHTFPHAHALTWTRTFPFPIIHHPHVHTDAPSHTNLLVFPHIHILAHTTTHTDLLAHLCITSVPPLALRTPDLLVSLCCSPPENWMTAAASPVTSSWRAPAPSGS